MQGIIVDFFVKPEFPQNIAPEEIRLKRHLQVPVLALQIYGHIAVGLRDDKIGLVSAEPYVNGAKAESGNGIVILDGPVECGKCVGREGGRGEGKVDPAAGGVVEPGVVSLGSAAPGQNQERWLERQSLGACIESGAEFRRILRRGDDQLSRGQEALLVQQGVQRRLEGFRLVNI